MWILVQLAWRNLWRERRRSAITAAAMAVGVSFSLVTIALMDGMFDDTFRLLVRQDIGHVQINNPEYPRSQSLYDTIPGADLLLSQLDDLPRLSVATGRLYGYALLGVGDHAAGAKLRGVLPQREARATALNTKLQEGNYLGNTPNDQILLGTGLADTLHASVGDEVVAVTQAADGSLGNELYHVAGIIRTGNVVMDRAGAILHLEDLRDLLALPGSLHEITLLAQKDNQAQALAESAGEVAGEGLLVRDWQEVNPQAKQVLALQGASTGVILAMVLSVAALGVLNTLLMSVYERTREFGVLRALGMRPRQIVGLVLLESAFLSILAMIPGLALGLAGDAFLVWKGIDLGMFMESDSWSWMGVALPPVFHGVVKPEGIIATMVGLVVVALFSALWPALRAASLKPVDAMRQE